MQLLSRRPAAAARYAAEICVALLCRTQDRLGLLITGAADRTTFRHPRAATISAADDAVHAAAHEATWERELYPRLQE